MTKVALSEEYAPGVAISNYNVAGNVEVSSE